MFIKKDLRKIPKILEDAVDCHLVEEEDDNNDAVDNPSTSTKRIKKERALTFLPLGRRSQEFCGNTKILCEPSYVGKLTHLQNLNMYDNQITSIDGLGSFLSQASPQLHTINLGRNPLQEIPNDFALIKSLRNVWFDDCLLEGPLPKPLLELPNLQTLRLPNNKITSISPAGVQENLRLVCLDRNQLTDLPDMRKWTPNLEQLMVRHNLLSTVTELPTTLQILHISSNSVQNIDFITPLKELTHVYVNSNQLTHLPAAVLEDCPKLQRLVISHNSSLTELPSQIWEYIQENSSSENDDTGSKPLCEILWQPNPNLTLPTAMLDDDNSDDDDDDDLMKE
jgi:Leucine-rich repeat (LRR) protein